MQHSLKSPVTISGIGLHSGKEVVMVIHPAPADYGIVFVRSDVSERDSNVPARWDNVIDTRLCTMIANDAGVSVGTVEHLMAALRGCGVDNAIIELDGPEVPVMDGSAAPFVEAIDKVGTKIQEQPRRGIKILKEITVEQDGNSVTLRPGNKSVFSGEIDFDHPSIGEQGHEIQLVNGNFRHDLADARTFGFVKEVEALRSMGLALGGSLDNAIVLNSKEIINDEGLRYDDEFIRHKLLDAIGDIYLAGGPVIGTYSSVRAGHALNNAILRKLFETKDAWVYVDLFSDSDAGEDQDSHYIVDGRPSVAAVA